MRATLRLLVVQACYMIWCRGSIQAYRTLVMLEYYLTMPKRLGRKINVSGLGSYLSISSAALCIAFPV